MTPLAYERAASIADALRLGTRPGHHFIAGGTDLIPLWRSGTAAPLALVDVSRLPLAETHIDADGLTLGALALMNDVACHEAIAHSWPALTQALLSSASPQVRHMATVGGNLLQRTRCNYFRSADLPCNKRVPGSGCPAPAGEHRLHAIFGTSEQCSAAHASDLAVALLALDAQVQLIGPAGPRSLPIEHLYRQPGTEPERDTVLVEGEMMRSITVPRSDRARSLYLKVRDRASFGFAVVSVAVWVERGNDGHVSHARIAAGGVGTVPWRLRASEEALLGRTLATATPQAAAMAAGGARPLADNAFKCQLLRNSVQRALEQLERMA